MTIETLENKSKEYIRGFISDIELSQLECRLLGLIFKNIELGEYRGIHISGLAKYLGTNVEYIESTLDKLVNKGYLKRLNVEDVIVEYKINI